MVHDLYFLFIHGHHCSDYAPKFVAMLDYALTNLGYLPLALRRASTWAGGSNLGPDLESAA